MPSQVTYLMDEICLFPLPLVIFPGGKLPLQIFEKRYIDMIRSCLKEDKGFGVLMIESGDQVIQNEDQASPLIASCGTYCRIIDFNQQSNGLLEIILEGERKFSVLSQSESIDRLISAQVNFLDLETDSAIPDDKRHLADLLIDLSSHVSTMDLVFDEESALDVSSRLSELLPCANFFKQQMLELKSPLLRLEHLEDQVLKMQEDL
ncbi:MAG: Lon protease-like protein [Candidatus Azotimanducaceae bacterium]|jgi:Lon protease-like protein